MGQRLIGKKKKKREGLRGGRFSLKRARVNLMIANHGWSVLTYSQVGFASNYHGENHENIGVTMMSFIEMMS